MHQIQMHSVVIIYYKLCRQISKIRAYTIEVFLYFARILCAYESVGKIIVVSVKRYKIWWQRKMIAAEIETDIFIKFCMHNNLPYFSGKF